VSAAKLQSNYGILSGMEKRPVITVLGTGYVGLTTATLTAMAGMKTYVVDPNPSRIASVRAGKSFFYEAGLDPLIAEVVTSGMLVPTDSYEQSVPESDIVISCVGTPDNPDGSSNLSYIFAAATEAARYLKSSAVYVQKSTVPVGTGKKVKQVFADVGITNAYVSNPEFLREGTALADTLWPDRIVVGGNDANALQRVIDMYASIEQARDTIAEHAGLDAASVSRETAQPVRTKLESAELIKVTSNAFLTVKISFANSIAQLADAVGADIVEVMGGVGADARIGQAFLQAGRGYGGGCFPKDVSGLIAAGLEHGVQLTMMEASQAVNESMPGYIIEKMQSAVGGDGMLNGKRIAVLGLAFKTGTSDTRRSPGIKLANMLVAAGCDVCAFDPKATEEAKESIDGAVTLADSIEHALHNADAAIIATDWPDFVDYPYDQYAKHMSGTLLVDAMNRLDPEAAQLSGLRYIGVGRG
jgi:UDPglucose 6-dehydrogenase